MSGENIGERSTKNKDEGNIKKEKWKNNEKRCVEKEVKEIGMSKEMSGGRK